MPTLFRCRPARGFPLTACLDIRVNPWGCIANPTAFASAATPILSSRNAASPFSLPAVRYHRRPPSPLRNVKVAPPSSYTLPTSVKPPKDVNCVRPTATYPSSLSYLFPRAAVCSFRPDGFHQAIAIQILRGKLQCNGPSGRQRQRGDIARLDLSQFWEIADLPRPPGFNSWSATPGKRPRSESADYMKSWSLSRR